MIDHCQVQIQVEEKSKVGSGENPIANTVYS